MVSLRRKLWLNHHCSPLSIHDYFFLLSCFHSSLFGLLFITPMQTFFHDVHCLFFLFHYSQFSLLSLPIFLISEAFLWLCIKFIYCYSSCERFSWVLRNQAHWRQSSNGERRKKKPPGLSKWPCFPLEAGEAG